MRFASCVVSIIFGPLIGCLLDPFVGTSFDMAYASTPGRFSEVIGPGLQSHCVKCHGQHEDIEGDVDLHGLSHDELLKDTELIRSLIEVLDFEEMPPEDEPAMPSKLRKRLIKELTGMLHAAVADRKGYAPSPLRRMTRFQYNNAVIDLFDLNCTVFTLPERMMRDHREYFRPESGKMADEVTVGSRPLGKSQLIEKRLAGVAAFPQDPRAEHGFDNQGDHLSLSPLLMESFLKLGQSITESPDFTPKMVGIWNAFFAAPKSDADLEPLIRQRLEPFLTKAFRQPADGDVLDRYARFVFGQIQQGVDFTDAMKSATAAVIASPKFLYLYDKPGEAVAAQPLDDFELATRLSFFLWGSLPDHDLIELASRGELSRPEVLDAQVDRMLKDRKLKRFCDSFPSQWLQLERIISSRPNPQQFPGFYIGKYRQSMHMMLEPLLLFETVLIENQPITQLIDADFTYRSRNLDEAYNGLGTTEKPFAEKGGGISLLTFYRVPVTDRRTGGVITNAAVMTMTSGPNRTQPITRGAWIAGVIFNNPPEPPPADVPPLDEKPHEGDEHLTLRERLSIHRERSDCKGCHEQIDPLGFALENYDPVGIWREKYDNGRDVDMSGTLFRKHKFKDIVEFKDAILVEKDRFTRALAGHLLSFAVARRLTAADQIALGEIVKKTAASKYRMQSLLKQVIFSEPFLTKTHIASAQ
tara:strand:+ start:99400 stop:101493 length:2094 start_codon:yes stop_codon:yes gene_type:complete